MQTRLTFCHKMTVDDFRAARFQPSHPQPRFLECRSFASPVTAVARYLQRTIQTSDKGHNSAEDAIAALELAQLKVSRGPNFGAERSTDSIFDRLQR